MAHIFDVMDASRARYNGICQIVVGSLCIVFNAAILIMGTVNGQCLDTEQQSGAGIWAGIFYIVSGSLIFVASSRRIFDFVVSALIMNLVSLILSFPHLILMSVSIMSRERDNIKAKGWDYPAFASLFR